MAIAGTCDQGEAGEHINTTPVSNDYSFVVAVKGTGLRYGTSLEEQHIVLNRIYNSVAGSDAAIVYQLRSASLSAIGFAGSGTRWPILSPLGCLFFSNFNSTVLFILA